jgi:hypothetical protein
MHDMELHNLYSAPNIGMTKSKMIMGETGIAYKMSNSLWKLGRAKCRWEYNIKIGLKEIG